MFGYSNIQNLILTGFAIIISLSLHEYAHAKVSTMLGDRTPERYGRLTLNPLAHIDPVGLLSLFVFKFGWAKPVPISPYFYKNPRLGVILTSIAGPISNLLLSFFSTLTLFLMKNPNQGLEYFLVTMIFMNAGLFVFNLIPVPPLDGSKIIAEIFDGSVAEFVYNMERYGTFVLFALLWFDPVNNLITTIINYVVTFMITIVRFIV